MYNEDFCSFCDQYFSRIRFIGHISLEIFFVFLVFLKYLMWVGRTLPTISESEKGPCKKCKHSAYWHMLEPDGADTNVKNLGSDPVTAFYVFKNIVFKVTRPVTFTICLKCELLQFKKDREDITNHEYVKLSKLEYLEWKHDKNLENIPRP